MRVPFEIEELPLRRFFLVDRPGLAQGVGVVVNEFVAPGADAVMGVDVMVGQMHPVAVVHRLRPVVGCAVFEERIEAAALKLARDLDPGIVQKGRREVDVGDDTVVDGTGLDGPGIADDEGHAQRFFVHEALIVPAVIAKKEALVRGIDDDGVVGEALFVEIVQDATDIIVDAGNAAQIVLYIALIFPVLLFFRRQTFGHRLLEIALGEVLGDRHSGGPGGGGAIAVIVVEGLRSGNVDILIHVRVFVVGVPGAVRRFVVIHQEEGFVFIAFF